MSVNEKDTYWNKTALHFASESGYAEIVDLLLLRPDIDVDAKDGLGLTAFDLAKTDAIKKAIKPKSDQDADDGNSADTNMDSATSKLSFESALFPFFVATLTFTLF